LAEIFRGEIVNCDSIQVYRGLEIGSAKTPASARRGIPHHLLDILNVDQELSAGAYSRLARSVLAEVRTRGHLPIVAGGTGFYLRALFDGLSPAPTRHEALRTRLRAIAERRPAVLHRFLRIHDSTAALRIHPNDRQKLIRALELTVVAGQPASRTQAAPRDRLEGFTVLKLGLAPPRALLCERLDHRSAAMFRDGLLEETQQLLESGAPPQATALQSLGYKQALAVLAAQLTVNQAIQECQTKTRQYAKRQMTWFRHEPGMEWLNGFGSDPEIQQQAVEASGTFLNSGAFKSREAREGPESSR
jgi:tRNA dimethylallyltransferase